MVKNLGERGRQSAASGAALGAVSAMGPSVVCLAFSIELYMKHLHAVSTAKVPRGHSILKLYRNLPRQIRREIFAHESISENPFAMRGPVLLRKRFSGNRRAYYGFLQQVKSISNGFEEWRYSYERTTLQYEVSFALSFVEAVKSAASIRRPR
ncbi:MAG: hypothetical protein Tsb0032_19030 [Kiloniellaceae bacterium]